MQFGPHFEPQASSQGKARPWPNFKILEFRGFPTGFKNDRKLCVSRVQSWGGPACELVGAVRMNMRMSIDMYLHVFGMYFFTNYSSAKF